MSQPANDDYSQHLSDDEASYHEDASDNGTATNKPKQQQQQLNSYNNHYFKYQTPNSEEGGNGKIKERESQLEKMVLLEYFTSILLAKITCCLKRERKARTILLMAIPKEHLRRFHGMDDAKEIWEAIRTRFPTTSLTIEAHVLKLSTEDGKIQFLRSLPPAWSNLAMTMRTKPDVDTLSIG
ncbi:hypothetical protein Tco_0355889 [Tanacetum coccineum]